MGQAAGRTTRLLAEIETSAGSPTLECRRPADGVEKKSTPKCLRAQGVSPAFLRLGSFAPILRFVTTHQESTGPVIAFRCDIDIRVEFLTGEVPICVPLQRRDLNWNEARNVSKSPPVISTPNEDRVTEDDTNEVEGAMPRQDALLRLYRRLLAQRTELQHQLALDISHAGDSGAAMGDSADLANGDVERELSTQLASLESRELEQIEAAIQALKLGRYGTCEECQKAIPLARLQAVPHSTTCIECQRSEERGGRKKGTRTDWTSAWRDEVRARDVETTLETLSIPVDR